MATGTNVALDRTTDPDGWAEAANAPHAPIVTQWDDGDHEGLEPGRVPTSSASQPTLVYSMLLDLDVLSGMRVLEIGTGTGWNAALLSCRLGDANVTTVEVDPEVSARARAALKASGYTPEVVCADGSLGWLASAPYDRIIVTCGVREIPPAWLSQTRVGGLILAPFGTHYGHQDALVKLTVQLDGTASGPFLGPVQFMKMRSQRLVRPAHPDFPGDSVETSTRVRVPLGDWEPFTFAASLLVPGVTHLVHERDDGVTVLWLYSLADTSWAAVFYDEEAEWEVYQSGPRKLWDLVEAAHAWWQSAGEPDFDRFGMTVGHTAGRTFWLDGPEQPLPVLGVGPR
ncbi:protein-L-isoaspartate(D-aspartate) O-methyltransferase [Streptomyces tateyamensis]|uniref:Protein-L-isoaspartate O-methyltransferase n=2 Tax=Streptomyces tateyamensis TaxID=565073 RepID=A0A2V4PIS0_9ACTN|nr:protein-L-isoaspartate(D-aspartate) O-methyltransferase [Streptomyces tateyamensis]